MNYKFKDIKGEKAIALKTRIKGQALVIDPGIPTEIVIDGTAVSSSARFEYALRSNKTEEWVYII